MQRFRIGVTGVPASSSFKRGKKEKLCFTRFYFASDYCSVEELQDYFSKLGDVSAKRKNDALSCEEDCELSKHLGLYLSGPSAAYVFALAENWHLQDEVKYLALELFNRFMSSLVVQLHHLIHENLSDTATTESTKTTCNPDTKITRPGCKRRASSGRSDNVLNVTDKSTHQAWVDARDAKTSKTSAAAEEWERTLVHLKGQCELRAVTCLMIASKVSCHFELVTISKAMSFLKKQGHRYSRDALLKSELRILKSMNYCVHGTPTLHTYVTVMLEILCRSKPEMNLRECYPIVIRLLNLFYYFRPSIFSRLCDTTLSESGVLRIREERVRRLLVEAMNDYLLPSAAIIASAVYLKDKPLSDRIISMLCQMIGVGKPDVTRFSYTILDVVLAHGT